MMMDLKCAELNINPSAGQNKFLTRSVKSPKILILESYEDVSHLIFSTDRVRCSCSEC